MFTCGCIVPQEHLPTELTTNGPFTVGILSYEGKERKKKNRKKD